MTITLGALSLPNTLRWAERYTAQLIAGNERRTLGGSIVYSNLQLVGGRPITLNGGEDFGWMTRTQVESVLTMAQDPIGSYTLAFNGINYTVVFRHAESPAAEFAPLIARTADFEDDWYVGTIKLITL